MTTIDKNAADARFDTLLTDRWDAILHQLAIALSHGDHLDDVGCMLDAAEGGVTVVLPFEMVRVIAQTAGPPASAWAEEPASRTHLRVLAIFPDGQLSTTTLPINLPGR